MSTIWIAGYAAWTSACDGILANLGVKGRWMDPGDVPEPGTGLLSGSAADWYPFLDRVLRQSGTVLLGNPGTWSLHDLTRLEHVADESGARVVTFRPWRSLAPAPSQAARLVRLRVDLSAASRWKPALGHAIDLILDHVGTEHLLRADAIRTADMHGPEAQLLAHLRFQNGAVAQLAMERQAADGLLLSSPSRRLDIPLPDESSELDVAIGRLLDAPESLPTLQQAIAGRKIEEKIVSILRQA
ncbi:MAG: hypothetical protein O3C45_01245 [Bacteroidetes bacterium]|nr:hypothetical protein [Bacteroidota bacterium]MDA0873665.1 hypothetical protein [Bacteroidota bacterium]